MKFILPILFILVSIVAFIFFVNPTYKDVSNLKSSIAIYNAAIDNATNLEKTEYSLISKYNEIKQSDKERLTNFLPDAVKNIEFILEIERIANLHGMPIKDIKFDPVKKDNTSIDPNIIVAEGEMDNRPYGVFPIQFTTEGKYDAFILFLKDLEYNLRLVDIKSVDFNIPDASVKNADGVDPNVYSYTLKVETYWLK